MSLWEPAVGVPALALATTAHLALAAVRNHRSPGTRAIGSLAFASGLFGALPWLMPALPGLVLGILLHVVWFAACERWLIGAAAPPTRVPLPARASTPAPAPRATGFIPVPVLSVVDESPDIRTFRLARPPGFDFEAGQFLAVRLRVDGREQVRCYSISSPPEARGFLEISVKRQGLVSGALHATMQAGSLLPVRTPAGSFRYPADDDRPLLLVAGGVGITPLISMVRHASLGEPTRPVTLLYSARHEHDLAFRDELAWLAKRGPRLRVTFAVSSGTPPPDVYPGRIDEALLRTVSGLEHSIALICGPQGLIDSTAASLASLGMTPERIRFERFDAAVAASTRAGQPDAAPRHRPEAAFTVRTAPSGREIAIAPGQTLLEAAEQHGLEIPSICRAGVCGTCRTRVLDGDMECASALLDEQDRASGYVLACVTSARSDCVIEG